MISTYTAWFESKSSVIAEGTVERVNLLRSPPPGGCRLKYHVTGPAGSGRITADGWQGDVPVREVVSFNSPRWYLGTKTFTLISEISIDWIPNECTVQIDAVNSSGNPITWTTIGGPYAVSIRRVPRDAERIAEAGEARTYHEYYILATDEEGLQAVPGQRFTISELPGMEFEVWSPMKPVASPLGETILRREFIARRVSP